MVVSTEDDIYLKGIEVRQISHMIKCYHSISKYIDDENLMIKRNDDRILSVGTCFKNVPRCEVITNNFGV